MQAMRFIGHLDLLRVWERTLRRAKVPIAYTQGFHPRPRLNLGAALPLGFTSAGELLDFWISEQRGCNELAEMIQRKLPSGLKIERIEAIQNDRPSLQQEIIASEYEVRLDRISSQCSLRDQISRLLNAEELPRLRQGKSYDLRPLIESLALRNEGKKAILNMRLKAMEGATGRPEEVLLAMGLDPYQALIHRKRLILA
jgi:radical SAM-linked protein